MSTSFYGVDNVGDAITVLGCGHAIGYPLTHIERAAEAGAGLQLRCDRHGCNVFIEPEHVPSIADAMHAWLETHDPLHV
jgi:hypothetical protein